MNEIPKDPKAPTPRTPSQTLAAIEHWDLDAVDAEADRLAALSPEQLEAELREAGIDPAVERARGEAIIDMLLGRSPTETPNAPTRPALTRDLDWTKNYASTADLEAEMDRFLALTSAEKDAELVAAGFDLAEVEAEADDFLPRALALQAEADRLGALSPEALDAELRAAGFDPAVERAKGEAVIEGLLRHFRNDVDLWHSADLAQRVGEYLAKRR